MPEPNMKDLIEKYQQKIEKELGPTEERPTKRIVTKDKKHYCGSNCYKKAMGRKSQTE